MAVSRYLSFKDRVCESPQFGEMSGRSIVVETFDKLTCEQKCALSNRESLNCEEYSSFSKRLHDYKQSLISLMDSSKNQKQQYINRMIEITSQSRNRVISSRSNKSSSIS